MEHETKLRITTAASAEQMTRAALSVVSDITKKMASERAKKIDSMVDEVLTPGVKSIKNSTWIPAWIKCVILRYVFHGNEAHIVIEENKSRIRVVMRGKVIAERDL